MLERRRFRVRPKLILALLAVAALWGYGASAEDWRIEPQELRREQFFAAKKLAEERIDVVTEAATVEGPRMIPNAAGNGHDLLFVYFNYGITFDDSLAVVVDAVAGDVKRFVIPKRLNLHLALGRGVFDAAGRFYLFLRGVGAGQLWCYDPAKKTFAHVASPPAGLGGGYTRLTTGPDGKVYGTTTKKGQVGLYSYDPAMAKVQSYGLVSPAHTHGGETHGYTIAVKGDYAYVACGKVPWRLVAVHLETLASKVILEAPAGNAQIWLRDDYAMRRPDPQDPKKVEYYDLTDGKAVPKEAGWKPGQRPKPPKPAKAPPGPPEIWTGALKPLPSGQSVLWYKLPGAKDWRQLEFKVKTYPQSIVRLTALPDGRLFGTPGHYEGNFVYDPRTGASEWLGPLKLSHYATAVAGGKVYLSGYPNSPVYEYDPTQPWTAGRAEFGQRPPRPEQAGLNPRQVVRLTKSWCHKMWAAAVGIDGKVYFCGEAARQGNGGGLGWWDPVKQEADALPWQQFAGHKLLHATATAGGEHIVMHSQVTINNLTGKVPDSAKMFVFDVRQGKIVQELEPIPGAKRLGPVLGVGPDRVIGVASMAAGAGETNQDLLYGFDLKRGQVVFRKQLPVPFFCFSRGMRGGQEFLLGPDGWIWTYVGFMAPGNTTVVIPPATTTLIRINPATAEIKVVGQVGRRGPMVFVGKDLYRGCEHKSGHLKLRRLAGIAR